MIIPTGEPPQYIVVLAIDTEMKDMIWYHYKYLTINIPSQTGFFEKC